MKSLELVKQLKIAISKQYKRNEIEYADFLVLQSHLDKFVEDLHNSVEFAKVSNAIKETE